MGFAEDRKSNLVEKISKDISGFTINQMSNPEMNVSMDRLMSRTADTVTCGTKIENVKPFSEIEEKEYFNLYANIRKKALECNDAEEFERIAQDIIRIQTILIYQHMPLVCAWMHTSSGRSSSNRHMMSQDDKHGEGNRILMRCVDRFDFTRGIKFCTYVFSALNKMVLKDARDNKKRKVEVDGADIDFRSIPGGSFEDSPRLVEVKEIWDDCTNGKGAASFLTDIERAIIQAEFSENNDNLDQESKAKILNMNVETFRKKKRNAFQKIKDAILSRLSG